MMDCFLEESREEIISKSFCFVNHISSETMTTDRMLRMTGLDTLLITD